MVSVKSRQKNSFFEIKALFAKNILYEVKRHVDFIRVSRK